ncbi:hypothetical protein AVEN_192136-1 [Araneus ventricosus]|uniref:Uncharacterized protein n=1 Tax=Araneus ventricosus TaxID=182803 RepID=A0A4Y2QSD7_ARAVE|nr:hypothetical protein AVEN_192136-1 [Araneus ventricosus]
MICKQRLYLAIILALATVPELVYPSWVCGSWHYLLFALVSPYRHLLPEKPCFVTVEDLLGMYPLGSHQFGKSFGIIPHCLLTSELAASPYVLTTREIMPPFF